MCLCMKVSLRKLVNFAEREKPSVPSQMSECLGAGTGCGWCRPFLTSIFNQWEAGKQPDLPVSPEEYAARRKQYHALGKRDDAAERGE